MEIAENITWTEELERLDVLLSQGQFELLLPGERYGGGEKEIWLVYLMNDAAESFLVFHDAELTGTYQKEYEGEIDKKKKKRVYLSDIQQHEHIQSLNSKVCQPSHFELFHHSILYFTNIRLHFHADKFYSSYFAICSFYYSQLLTH